MVDPRRWGALIGVAGGLTFVFAYGQAANPFIEVGARAIAVVLAMAVVLLLLARPRSLGPLRRPDRTALIVYVACVVGELALINIGTRALTAAGREPLRPALITAVVGLHFLPFAWAFGERMFTLLGLVLAGCGVLGLAAGLAGADDAPRVAAVLGGVAMLALVLTYARGRFAPTQPVAS